MLNKSDLIGFVATSNVKEARRFYETSLGLTFVSEDQFALVLDANGAMLRIQKVDHVDPKAYTVLGWKVTDLEKQIHTLAERGIQFARYEGMNQDENGIWTAPGKARIAWFTDPDGNLLSLTQFP